MSHLYHFLKKPQLGACVKSRVIIIASDIFARFAGFEGEYLLYLTEKRVKQAEIDDAKMVAGLFTQAPRLAK